MDRKLVQRRASRSGEYGGARLKFVIVVLIVAIVGYAGYMYVPIAYQAYYIKDLMQHDVDVAATQGYKVAWVADQLKKSANDYSIPTDAIITTAQEENRVTCRLQFTKAIEFPGYTYQYEFDYTAKSTTFFSIK
jgi:hypothetical protein